MILLILFFIYFYLLYKKIRLGAKSYEFMKGFDVEMANKKAHKALALVLSAATVASVSVPAITSSVMVSAATSSVINMAEVKSNLTIKKEINGTDLGDNKLLKSATTTITVNTGDIAANKFTYAFKVYKPASDGKPATTTITKSVAMQTKNYFTFRPEDTGNYTLLVNVVNKSTGESFTKSFNLEVIASTKIADNQTVYDTNGNRYKVLSASSKTLALTGITESKTNPKVGFEFDGGTVSIVDKTLTDLPVNMDEFKITQFGDGTNKVERIKFDANGNPSGKLDDPFKEINIPSTVEVIKANSLSRNLVKCVYKTDKSGKDTTEVKTDALVILGSKDKNDLYSSKLRTIEKNGIASDMIATTVFRTYHTNIAASSCVVDSNIVRSVNGYKFKFSWLNDMPAGAKLEAPFGSWAWTAMQIIARFDCSKEDTTYTHANGYGSAAKKNFKVRSTENGSLSKPLHDSVYDRDMIVAVNFYNNKQVTASSTPKYRLVVNNGGFPSVLNNGTMFVIDSSIYSDLILKRKVDKSTGVYKIYPNTQADTGLNKNDKIECNVKQTYNIGKGATDDKIEMLDFENLGCIAYNRIGSSYVKYGDDGKLTANAPKLFDVAVTYPVYKLREGSGYIAFKASSVDYGTAYKLGQTGGEGTVQIAMPANASGLLTNYNNQKYTMSYHIQTKDELAGKYNDNGIGAVTYTRGKWNNTQKKFEANTSGDRLKINFNAKADRYYLVEYVDMTSDNDEVKVLWDGAAKGVKGFDSGSDKGLLLDSKTNDNKFYEIRVTEFTNSYQGTGYGMSARFTAYPVIDGRGFLKVYQSNKELAAGVTEELDFNTKGMRFIKYYGTPGCSYKIYRYSKNEGTKVITDKDSGKAMTNTNTTTLCNDTFGVYNNAINVTTHEFSTAVSGVNISDYCLIKKVSGTTEATVPAPRVWLSSCDADDVTGKNASGAARTLKNVMKVCTYSAKGVRLNITGGSNGYYYSDWTSSATKKACRAISPKVASDGTISDNKMKVTVNVDDFKTRGKSVDRQTIKVVYSTNFRKNGYSLSNSGITWKDLPGSEGAFTTKDSVEFTPVNGLVFYRIAYKYVNEDTVRYTNIKAVTYNALTSFSTSQQIKAEPLSNIGSATVLNDSVYNKTYDSTDDTVIINQVLADKANPNTSVVNNVNTLKISECFAANGQISNANKTGTNGTFNPLLVILNAARSFNTSKSNAVTWKTVTVPTSYGTAKITINNAYSSAPAKSTLTSILKTSKNLNAFDGIVTAKKYATVQFTTHVYSLTTTGSDKTFEITGATDITETTDKKNVVRVNNISYTASKPTDMKGTSDITLSTVKADGTVDREEKYLAIVQNCVITNPNDVGYDTSFSSSNGNIRQKSQARVYFIKLQERSYEPIREHNSKIALKKTDAQNTDEIKIKVTGCYTKDDNPIFSAFYKKSGSNKKLFNLELDELGALDDDDTHRLNRTLGVFNPSQVVLKFNYTRTDGKTATASFIVNRTTWASGEALKTSYASTDKTDANNSSVFLVKDGKVTGFEYVITAKRILKYLQDNGADMTKFSNGTINATLYVYSAAITAGKKAANTEVETIMPALANSAYRSYVTIDVSDWKA